MPRSSGVKEYALRTVVTPTPNVRAISRQGFPRFRSSTALLRSRTTLGLPTGLPLRVPCARARSSPARTRSEIRTRSCLAIHAATAIINSPAGPVLRKCASVKLTNRTPCELRRRMWSNVSGTPSRESRSRAHTTRMSNSRREASIIIARNCARSDFPPDSWSSYSAAMGQPCAEQNSRSCRSWFAVSWPLSRVETRMYRAALIASPWRAWGYRLVPRKTRADRLKRKF